MISHLYLGLSLVSQDETPPPTDRCQLHLPSLSGFREPITGPGKNSKKAAKRAVALRAVAILHKKGELDDRLLPTRPEVSPMDDEDDEALEEGQPKAGTKRRKRYYEKELPQFLT